jgi:hypothetical protein
MPIYPTLSSYNAIGKRGLRRKDGYEKVSGTGLSRTVTAQITNVGTADAHNVWAKVEVFLLRELEPGLWEVLVKPARKVRVGNRLSIGKDFFSHL